jgi:hypothetical protein
MTFNTGANRKKRNQNITKTKRTETFFSLFHRILQVWRNRENIALVWNRNRREFSRLEKLLFTSQHLNIFALQLCEKFNEFPFKQFHYETQAFSSTEERREWMENFILFLLKIIVLKNMKGFSRPLLMFSDAIITFLLHPP